MNDSFGNIYILGAGGKMGDRITNSLIRSGITPAQYEISDSGIEIIHEKGLDITPPEQAMPQADVAIFALPDRLLGKLTAEYVPLAKPGSLIILLDPAVVFAREAYLRNDCTTAVMHPCHPQLFFEQPNEEARNDHFGGIAGLQDIVISFVNGERKLFDEVAMPLSRLMFSPVMNSFEITVEKMALLEPSATEVINTSLIQAMRVTMDEVVRAGIPEAAAKSFVLGHMQQGLAVYFLNTNPISDAAQLAARAGWKAIIKPDWKQALGIEFTRDITKKMLHPELE